VVESKNIAEFAQAQSWPSVKVQIADIDESRTLKHDHVSDDTLKEVVLCSRLIQSSLRKHFVMEKHRGVLELTFNLNGCSFQTLCQLYKHDTTQNVQKIRDKITSQQLQEWVNQLDDQREDPMQFQERGQAAAQSVFMGVKFPVWKGVNTSRSSNLFLKIIIDAANKIINVDAIWSVLFPNETSLVAEKAKEEEKAKEAAKAAKAATTDKADDNLISKIMKTCSLLNIDFTKLHAPTEAILPATETTYSELFNILGAQAVDMKTDLNLLCSQVFPPTPAELRHIETILMDDAKWDLISHVAKALAEHVRDVMEIVMVQVPLLLFSRPVRVWLREKIRLLPPAYHSLLHLASDRPDALLQAADNLRRVYRLKRKACAVVREESMVADLQHLVALLQPFTDLVASILARETRGTSTVPPPFKVSL